MKLLKRMTALLLIAVFLCPSVSAEGLDVEAEEGTGVYGAFGETPEEIILSAMEIFSWFTIWPLDVDPELCAEDGSVWRVADETLCNNETMMGLLNDTFSEEIVDEMLAYEVYTVINGMLYGTSGGRPIDPNISWVEYEETYSDEFEIIYTATVHYYGEGENGVEPDVFEFIRQQIDEKWVFTQFPFFW